MSLSGSPSEQYRGIAVFIEEREGRPAKVSLELLGKGRSLAEKLGTDVMAILIGEGITEAAEELIRYGADEVVIADDPVAKDYRTEVFTRIATDWILEKKPEILLMGATWIGRDLAPRVAARLKTGCTSDCTELNIDQETGLLLVSKPFWGKDVMADIICPKQRPQIATVRPGVLELLPPDATRRGRLIRAKIETKDEDVNVQVLETVRSRPDGPILEEAEKILAVGAGVDNQAGFEMLKELAGLLGAEIGATSLPVDAGWVPDDRKIGQTGKTVRPNLYIACGISGAIQHTVGMANSGLIIAINRNPKAEIFDFADYGIVDDLHKIVPMLIEELKGLKG
ncbi:MAG: electron transfer flavoprotein subunit alpha/FixB family protein [Desulfobacteraceae bacterium]|jgi:electron transfer flavoprotein alpha subunit